MTYNVSSGTLSLYTTIRGWGKTGRRFSRVHGPNLAGAWGNQSYTSDVENDAKFFTFLSPVKIRRGVDEISIPVAEAYLRLNLRSTFDGC